MNYCDEVRRNILERLRKPEGLFCAVGELKYLVKISFKDEKLVKDLEKIEKIIRKNYEIKRIKRKKIFVGHLNVKYLLHYLGKILIYLYDYYADDELYVGLVSLIEDIIKRYEFKYRFIRIYLLDNSIFWLQNEGNWKLDEDYYIGNVDYDG